MSNDLEINCIILVNSKHGYCFNKIMDKNKIEEMMKKLFEKPILYWKIKWVKSNQALPI